MREQYTRVTRKGQVTIPAEIRHALNLKEGDTVAWIIEQDQVRLKKSESVVARTAGALKGGPALSIEEEKAAFEQALAEDVIRRGRG
jgi:AbrB family looped-hinge helix DNA binding protein